MIDKQIYTPEQCPDIFNFLDTLEVEYHRHLEPLVCRSNGWDVRLIHSQIC